MIFFETDMLILIYLVTKCSKKENINTTCCGYVIIPKSNMVDEYAYFNLYCFCNFSIFVSIWEKGYFKV